MLAFLAGFAGVVTELVPDALIATLAGLAMSGVLSRALQQAASGPLLLGPLFTFTIALSDLSLLGLGPFLWALALGLAISLLVERDEWRSLHGGADTAAP